MSLPKNAFNYEIPDQMLEYLHSLKAIDNYNQVTSEIFAYFKGMVEALSESNEKNKRTKMLNSVDKILEFVLKEQKKRG